MKSYLTSILLLTVSFLSAQSGIDQYVEFLQHQQQSPKEYVLHLFETNDIVIIGERDHREITQYDLILDILGDKRFIDNVGHVYTEVGAVNRTTWANDVVRRDFASEKDFEEELTSLYRELDYHDLWDKYNMVKYLRGVYEINQTLPPDQRLAIGLTDCAFDWDGMTHGKYQEFRETFLYPLNVRDSVMADNFMTQYEEQEPINGRKKALLIQSRPHAIDLNTTYKGVRTKRVGSFIRDEYGERVKVVVFNWYNWVPPEWTSKRYGEPHEYGLSADGKWDAAYELSGRRSVGFDLEDTPFGLTPFDYIYDEDIAYQEIIDGIIFYLPFYEFQCSRGLPGIVDKKFAKELLRRNDIMNGDDTYSKEWTARDELLDWKEYREFECNDYEAMKDQMRKWLTDQE